MTFTESAIRLCGQCALVFGWRPTEFWGSTPAELGTVLAIHASHGEGPPDAAELRRLMDLFPDKTTRR